MCSAPKLDDVIEEEEEDDYCETEIENNINNNADNTTIDSETGTAAYDNFDELEKVNRDEDELEEEDEYFEDFNKNFFLNPNDKSCLKLPLSSSSSSSLTSETDKLSPGSPIFISSCSASSSISSSSTNNSSESQSISPNSEAPMNNPCTKTAPPHLKVLANDSGVCTSTSSVISTEILNKFNQVSYEFFDDLSKPPIKPILVNNHTNQTNSRFRTRSFNTKVIATGASVTPTTNSHFNPFSRGTISRSFSAFTSRLKQQQQNKSVSVDKHVQKTLTFNELVVEIEAKTDNLSLNEETEVTPQIFKKQIAPLPPTLSQKVGAVSPSKSFIKCYKNPNEFFYVNSTNATINKKSGVTRLKRDCSNSPLSSPELSSSSDISTYSTHSQTSHKETTASNLIDDAQYIISL